jgi:hypothetical protein
MKCLDISVKESGSIFSCAGTVEITGCLIYEFNTDLNFNICKECKKDFSQDEIGNCISNNGLVIQDCEESSIVNGAVKCNACNNYKIPREEKLDCVQ